MAERTAFPLIVRASLDDRVTAERLLLEYFEAVSVLRRDSPEEIAVYLTEADSGLWIAYLEGTPAGCVVLRPLAAVHAASECKRLYVRTQFRGLGIAGALLKAIEEHAHALGAEWVYLDSKDDLKDALRLYIRRDYKFCERYNDNSQATIFMRKQLRLRPAATS